MAVFQSRLVSGPKCIGGRPSSEIPEVFGPRNWGQFAVAADAKGMALLKIAAQRAAVIWVGFMDYGVMDLLSLALAVC